jgi:hypothetical protein
MLIEPIGVSAGSTHNKTKICAVCGRRFSWRKKWERDWEHVRNCSDRCRRRGIREIDRALEGAILDLLGSRDRHGSICPSEAARLINPEGWRDLMEDTRNAARRLVDRGVCVVTQRGIVVDPSEARGPIRIARA